MAGLDANVIKKFAAAHSLVTERVEQRKLDAYLLQAMTKKTLVKIDTEGNEIAVLRGATELLRPVRPKIIFESWPGDDRGRLFDFFQPLNYQFCPSLSVSRGIAQRLNANSS